MSDEPWFDAIPKMESVSPRSYSHLYGLTALPLDVRIKLLILCAKAKAAIGHSSGDDAVREGCLGCPPAPRT